MDLGFPVKFRPLLDSKRIILSLTGITYDPSMYSPLTEYLPIFKIIALILLITPAILSLLLFYYPSNSFTSALAFSQSLWSSISVHFKPFVKTKSIVLITLKSLYAKS